MNIKTRCIWKNVAGIGFEYSINTSKYTTCKRKSKKTFDIEKVLKFHIWNPNKKIPKTRKKIPPSTGIFRGIAKKINEKAITMDKSAFDKLVRFVFWWSDRMIGIEKGLDSFKITVEKRVWGERVWVINAQTHHPMSITTEITKGSVFEYIEQSR